jgi:hypothetical protein
MTPRCAGFTACQIGATVPGGCRGDVPVSVGKHDPEGVAFEYPIMNEAAN